MSREEFMTKHDFDKTDMRNLMRYTQVKNQGYDMEQYEQIMKNQNANGGKTLVAWIHTEGNYEEYLSLPKY